MGNCLGRYQSNNVETTEQGVQSDISQKGARRLGRPQKQQVFAVKLVSLLLLSLKCIGAVVLI